MTPGSSTRRRRRVVLALAAAAVAAGCGAPAAPPHPASAPSVIRTPDPVQTAIPTLPKGRPQLTLTGRITATNARGTDGSTTLRLDLAELDRLGLAEIQIDDPWAKRRVAVQGCWLRDVVALARPDPAATTLHLHALDDYQVDLALADVRSLDIFLATRTAQGTPLAVEDGGPTRVVFADDLAPRFSPDLWIWNIDTVDVR